MYISENPNITWEIIENNPDKDWSWMFISENPNITMEIIENNPDKNWDWYFISCNPNITWEIIENNPDKDWDWEGISRNPFTKERKDFMIQEYRKYLAAFTIQNRWRNARVNPNCKLGENKNI